MVAVVVAALGLSVALPNTYASAASFDNTSGFLRTSTGATASAYVYCNSIGATLTLNFGATRPNYYAWRIVNPATGQWASNWSAWQPVTSYSASPGYVITTPGNWWVAADIIHWNGSGWYEDIEYTVIQNANPAYGQRVCHVGR